ncbi:MAG: DUF6529 family protein [Actinophytocola sp.]|uniref:DUF6529 family protein n=1 Tax=Actinophytocola sp. TaxID=1872138 RepID=UPI003C72645E
MTMRPPEPPDFGPMGPPLDSDLTQPVPQHWLNETTTNVAPVEFDDDDYRREPANIRGVVAALGIGALVAVAMGVYGSAHEPTGEALNLAGFSDGLHAKAWLGSVAFVLAIVQVLSAMAMWGRLPGFTAGHGTAVLHRWSGRVAVIVSLPVAAHCLYALGFQAFDTRVLLHSLLGCFFYGLFVCKMVVLTRSRTPGWAVPVVGAAVFTALVGLWVTSSLWFFSEFGVSL